MQAHKIIKILLIHEDSMFREGLARLINDEPDLALVAHCADVQEAFEILSRAHIDLVLLNHDQGDSNAHSFFTLAGDHEYQGRVVVLTAGLDSSATAYVLAQGASSIVLRCSPVCLLLKTIRQVMNRELLVDPLSGDVWSPPDATPVSYNPGGRLSRREYDILAAVCDGLTNKEIADRFQISESLVKFTMQSIFSKTGVRTRSKLVRLALETHLYRPTRVA